MQVQGKLTFDDYWIDPRFKKKHPVMNGSKRQMYGDNIYHRPSPSASCIQENSHHSLPDGQKNELNYSRDLPGQYVLISNYFWYFGQNAISLPEELLFLADVVRGYIPAKLSVSSFVGYLKGKRALMIFDRHANWKCKYGNQKFLCAGYYVDTVGRNKKAIAEYIRNQLQEDIAEDQMMLKEYVDPFTGELVNKGEK